MDMDPAYVSAVVGLTGVVIGGLTSFASSWLVAWAQLRDKNNRMDRDKREALFREIITEASRLYGDALSHEKDDVTDLVKLYALIAQARLVASTAVVAAAERVMDTIIETYLAPNRTLHEMRAYAREGGLNFLLELGKACREELAGINGIGRRRYFW
jgi:hypothetical protein